jgi:hypothetical protein
MEPNVPSFPIFSVQRFTLVQKACGTASQLRQILGHFNDAEAAFEMARTEAWQALCAYARKPASSSPPEALELAVDDTEWGYDLRRNGRVVDRFWVHDRLSTLVP